MNRRLAKVQAQIRRILSEMLLKERDSFGVGIVSINDILVSRDLNTVKVWVSFIAEKNQEAAFKKLLRYTNPIQTYLFRNFPVKKVPKITWQLDTEPDATYRIDKLLDDIQPTSGPDQHFSQSDTAGETDSDRLASET